MTYISKVKELYVFNEGLHEIYIDFEKEEFFNKVLSWIVKTKGYGKTDKPFPIDIAIGPPRPIYNKIRFTSLFKIFLVILYFVIGHKLKFLLKGKMQRLFWPISLLKLAYKIYFN
jgi:hypothetical protein